MLWIATCPHETVDVLASELHSIGIDEQTKLYRGVMFECDLEKAYRAHLLLRTASRIQRVVTKFDLSDLSMLQTALKNINWPEWLRSHRPFIVRPTLADPEAQKLSEETIINSVVQSIQKSKFEKSPPKFDPEADNPITIVLFIRGGSCVLGIDTAGRALHKRGWRTTGHPAVLKETLAATILLLAGYNGDEPLLDPMCGSGTIPIEAAYIALNKAPLIHRGKDDFALEHLAGFDRALWRRVSDQLRAQKKSSLKEPIHASDIKAEFVEVARASALRARVEKYINFSVKAFADLEPPAPSGLLIANLPYGERIGSGIIDQLYREVGQVIKQRFSKWRVALLVPSAAPIHLLALKPTKEISLLNGSLPVKLLILER
jgi:putative N6-adenine-specific DNA methylase